MAPSLDETADTAAVWSRALAIARAEQPALAVAIEHVRLVSLGGGRAELEYEDTGRKFVLEQRLPKIGDLIAQAGGGVVTPSLKLAAIEAAESGPESPTSHELVELARKHPAVRSAMDILDATIVSVEQDSPPAAKVQDNDDAAQDEG